MEIALLIFLFLMTIVIHEVSHGYVAYRLGDPTAKARGRLSLNPLKHIDMFWTVLLPALLFISTRGKFAIGMAKPVPVNFALLHHPKRDMVKVAAAGPLANILISIVLAFVIRFYPHTIILYVIWFNLGLAMFNLIPIPPLDGSRILAGLLPIALARLFFKIERFGFMIILLLYFTGMLFYLIVPGVDFFCVLLGVPSLPVRF
ncbi:MAG: site-2 protease family protein [Candidatus Omnitrophica bacterium]|nr:site-2 protease family protein [Candidatus Omnitrophota bacterium]